MREQHPIACRLPRASCMLAGAIQHEHDRARVAMRRDGSGAGRPVGSREGRDEKRHHQQAKEQQRPVRIFFLSLEGLVFGRKRSVLKRILRPAAASGDGSGSGLKAPRGRQAGADESRAWRQFPVHATGSCSRFNR